MQHFYFRFKIFSGFCFKVEKKGKTTSKDNNEVRRKERKKRKIATFNPNIIHWYHFYHITLDGSDVNILRWIDFSSKTSLQCFFFFRSPSSLSLARSTFQFILSLLFVFPIEIAFFKWIFGYSRQRQMSERYRGGKEKQWKCWKFLNGKTVKRLNKREMDDRMEMKIRTNEIFFPWNIGYALEMLKPFLEFSMWKWETLMCFFFW